MNKTEEKALEDDYKLKRHILIALNGMHGKIDKLQSDLDSFRKDTTVLLEVLGMQSETIRQEVVQNSVEANRIKAETLLLRADIKELTEKIRQNKKG